MKLPPHYANDTHEYCVTVDDDVSNFFNKRYKKKVFLGGATRPNSYFNETLMKDVS